jgi:hypothetical protein
VWPACLSHIWKPEVVSGFHRAFEKERGKTTGGATVIPPEKENWATSEKIVRGSKCGAAARQPAHQVTDSFTHLLGLVVVD